MPVDLRARLVAAADEPAFGPDTDAILRRAGRRRRRARAVLAGGTAAAVALGALLVARVSLSPSDGTDVVAESDPAPAPAAVQIERTADEVIVRLLDPPADPAEVERQLRAAGIDATVEAEPVAVADVGKLLSVEFDYPPESGRPDPGGLPAEAATIDPDRGVVRFPRPASGRYRLRYGWPTSPVEIERTSDEIVVRLLESTADPAVAEEQIRAAGIDAMVEALPVSPSLVGQWVFLGLSPDASAMVSDPDDPGLLRFPVPVAGSHQMSFGRPALPTETYASSAGAFALGEPLHCTGVEKLTPAEAEQVINDLGFEVSWRLETATRTLDDGVSESFGDIVDEAPDGRITQATLLSPTLMVVFVTSADGSVAGPGGVDTEQGEC